ncbi:MAG: response regulator, partial [Nitrospinae bacterium]|nr:response regulator [Nitrospinota bacterium]
LNQRLTEEFHRVSAAVGQEGVLSDRAQIDAITGGWQMQVESINSMITNLAQPTMETGRVITAVGQGDLSQKMALEIEGRPLRGEFLRIGNFVNTMVDQLSSFSSEVTRVAREVGTDGKLGGQAEVKGVSGTWKDLTDNVNRMATNLTDQVRNIALVTTAVANGDLRKKLTLEAKGEIAELANTINDMIDTLATFAEQVTTVAREVGTDGKLGGQANVPGASGLWKDLTQNVNQLAANLTTQVRAIADVATAVTKGDLTRTIAVEAKGEVAELKDNINEMIRNLKETTEKNSEQDWLKTNLAKFTRMLQGQREMATVCKSILSELAPLVRAQHGVFYIMNIAEKESPKLELQASFAYKERKYLSKQFHLGEGLVGECALEKERILLTNVPPDYVQISSGLGEATPLNIVVLPVLFEGTVKAAIELASFERFSLTHIAFLEQLMESIGIVLNTIEANTRTEALLKQSQSMGQELQKQQEELQQTNEELEEKAKLLIDQNKEVERKNAEVETAKKAVEEKAAQLALTSKYKSEFLANMSHELRTPLNSLLLLSQQLSENTDRNLTEKQVGHAKTIHDSGNDLLNLINDILDLSKIESGMAAVDLGEVRFGEVRDFVEQTFRHVAEGKKLKFAINLDGGLPPTLFTDERRVKQILKNLLSNAFKFTSRGGVGLQIAPAAEGWSHDHPVLNAANVVIGFAVSDTGIGIPRDKQRIVFEAFQQADGGTSRKYGGTGLGLSISRELAGMLGGEIRLQSEPGKGTVFTLFLPIHYMPPAKPETPAGRPGNPGGLKVSKTPDFARPARTEEKAGERQDEAVSDDRAELRPGDRVALIVEDDSRFASILLDFARKRGFKGIVALNGQDGLAFAKRYKPDAVTLDIYLPDMSGWTVLDRLKHEPATRHIPVHIISVDENEARGLRLGALAHVMKPAGAEELARSFTRLEEFIQRRVKNLLIVEGDPGERDRIASLVGDDNVQITQAANAAEALAALGRTRFDCMILDLQLPGESGTELIGKIEKEPGLHALPIIVHTGTELDREEEKRLQKSVMAVVVKGKDSQERLLSEASLFLHKVEADMPESQRRILGEARKTRPFLTGRKVMIVDDDMRNIYAVSAVLERQDMRVVTAESGKEALDLLRETRDIDLILMDVMMPDMDGYETTRAIRNQEPFRDTPIIALTAKAMKGDREKCIEAGASDYISKPVDTEQLLSLLRVWLQK